MAFPLILFVQTLHPYAYMLCAFSLVVAAVVIADLYQREKGGEDRQDIVIDEIAGMFVAMTWIPLTLQSVIAGFVLFRLLDIVKPYPIGMLDKKLKGGFGVVMDDVAAGLIANIILQVIYYKTNWLGVTLNQFQ